MDDANLNDPLPEERESSPAAGGGGGGGKEDEVRGEAAEMAAGADAAHEEGMRRADELRTRRKRSAVNVGHSQESVLGPGSSNKRRPPSELRGPGDIGPPQHEHVARGPPQRPPTSSMLLPAKGELAFCAASKMDTQDWVALRCEHRYSRDAWTEYIRHNVRALMPEELHCTLSWAALA